MAQELNGSIENVVQGDNFDVIRSIDTLPAAITKAWLTVKPGKSSINDTTAIFQKTITTSNVPGIGVILDDGAGGIASVRFELTNADTVLLTNETVFYYDIQVLTSTGKIYTPELGKIRLKSERTKATS